MRRREFIALLGTGAVIWALPARAQQQAALVVGYVGGVSPDIHPAFREGLSEAGFTEGRNVTIESRWTEGHLERLPSTIVNLVRRPVAVIFLAGGDVPTLIAKGATRSIPIVFLTTSDPVRSGLVDSLNRPGVNATGVTMLSGPLGAKRLELLREVVRKATSVGMLVNPNNPNSERDIADLQAGARTIGFQVHLLEASNKEEIDKAYSTLVRVGAGALLVNADPYFILAREHFMALAARHPVPTIYYARLFVEDGGLISYGADVASAFRQCGNYVGKILKGEKPEDLPVQQPTKFELVINLKTARALGLTIPPTLLARADEVIE
jgi:putative tryptophan/tyrosine transport system substrate-binding protein